MNKQSFTQILHRVRDYAAGMGLIIIDSKTLNPYFKGDLNGSKIWINFDMNDEEELFNVLHMLGHCLQWGVSEELKALGSKLHERPDYQTLTKLLAYEREANCYGLQILHELGIQYLDEWLYEMYKKDLYLLTEFYRTGSKVTTLAQVSAESKHRAYEVLTPLLPKPIPKSFIPTEIEGTRDGIVIDFTS